METKILNYRIIVEPDEQTRTGKKAFTAYCPTLGVADDGETIEESLHNIKNAISAYVESLVSDGQPIPIDRPEQSLITTTQIQVKSSTDLTYA